MPANNSPINDADRRKIAASLHALNELQADIEKAKAVGHPDADEYEARCNHCRERLTQYMQAYPKSNNAS